MACFSDQTPELMTMPDLRTALQLVHHLEVEMKRWGWIASPRLEAEQLVCSTLNLSRLDWYSKWDRSCSVEEKSALQKLLQRRCEHEPLAYILGSTGFWSLDLSVGPGVLIPRPETECLVETALLLIDSLAKQPQIRVLEFGCGSAAISLALAIERQALQVVTVEDCGSAITYARSNLRKYQDQISKNRSQVSLIQTSHIDGLKPKPYFDFLLSNPPYIPETDIAGLQPEVRDWEPLQALNGGSDGLVYFRFLAAAGTAILKPKGWLVIEHGWNQRAQILSLFNELNRYTLVKAVKDIGGNDRVLVFCLNN